MNLSPLVILFFLKNDYPSFLQNGQYEVNIFLDYIIVYTKNNFVTTAHHKGECYHYSCYNYIFSWSALLSLSHPMLTLIDMSRTFDPELLYVECTQCGQPVLWAHGLTSKLLKMAGIDPEALDERCVIMSEGCPGCHPGETQFTTQVIRLNKEKNKKEAVSAAIN